MGEVKERRVTCIICPVGCEVVVRLRGNEIVSVSGATCPRGASYAIEEVRNPRRVVISVVRCVDGDPPTVSVKSSKPVPKDALWKIMELLAEVEVRPPVRVGQVIIKNVLNLGVDIVATRSCVRRSLVNTP